MNEYYKILDLDESADFNDLNEQYRKKIKQYHPDLFAGDPEKEKVCVEKTKKINIAYSELKKVLINKKRDKTDKNPMDEPRAQEIMPFMKMIDSALLFLAKILNFKDIGHDEGLSPNKIIKKTKPVNQSGFNEVLKKQMNGEQSNYKTKTPYSRVYQDMLRKRSLYGNRQKDGINENGPISPVSAVKGIRSGRIE